MKLKFLISILAIIIFASFKNEDNLLDRNKVHKIFQSLENVFLNSNSFLMENNSTACSDGIDNDGDGLIDCDDPQCQNLPTNGCSICSDGISFADVVLEYTSGCPQADPFPEGALGVSDYPGGTTDIAEFVFLGQGGSIKLGFTNNIIVNSGDGQLDLHVFEVGPAVEACLVSLRPLDAFTTSQLQLLGIPDLNSDNYFEFGQISGAVSGIDIDVVMAGYATGLLKFDAIEIMDVIDGNCASAVPGADIDAVCALSFEVIDCAGIPNGSAIIDECDECLEPNDPNFNQSCTDCAGTPNGNAIIDDCGECLEPNDPNFNQSCIDCNGILNGNAVIDDCGECLEPNDPNFNQSCADCAGIPNGSAIIDECGECLELNDPNFNQSCADCAGIPNGSSILDECGECLEPNDPNFNQSCIDCAGILNGNAILDECGECLELNNPNFNQACTDCAGTPNGNAIIDECGECLEPADPNFNQACTDCNGILNGTALLDECGVCLELSDPEFNFSCMDCAGVSNGQSIIDICGECLEPTDPNFNQSCLEDNKVYVPNCFSPNGDGINDEFRIYSAEGIVSTVKEYTIYGRWGEKIYSASNFDIYSNEFWWDGQFRGKDMDMSVFVYLIQIEFAIGHIESYGGDVTLIK